VFVEMFKRSTITLHTSPSSALPVMLVSELEYADVVDLLSPLIVIPRFATISEIIVIVAAIVDAICRRVNPNITVAVEPSLDIGWTVGRV